MKAFPKFTLVGFLLAGCVHAPSQTLESNQAIIAPSVILNIPPPATLRGNVTVSQIVAAHFHGDNYMFQAQIAISPDSLELAALDGMGRRAFSMSWTNTGINYKPAPWLPSSLRPSDILANIALVYWPDDALRAALSLSGAELIVTQAQRTIRMKGADIVTIRYEPGEGWNRAAHLRNLAFGYSLDIQSAEAAP